MDAPVRDKHAAPAGVSAQAPIEVSKWRFALITASLMFSIFLFALGMSMTCHRRLFSFVPLYTSVIPIEYYTTQQTGETSFAQCIDRS